MTKDEILDYAVPNARKQKGAKALAYQHATAEVIQAKVAQLEGESARVTVRLTRWTTTLFALLGTILLASFGLFTKYTIAAFLCSGVTMFLVMLVTHKIRKLEEQQRYFKGTLKELRPIAGTDLCQEALHYLEKDAPGVLTWRDIALSERGQLYNFDVGIMRQLHRFEESRLQSEAKAVGEQEKQRMNDEACRKVHGLAII